MSISTANIKTVCLFLVCSSFLTACGGGGGGGGDSGSSGGGGGGGGGSPPSASVQYFAANDGVNGLELWKTDGTTAGTVMVRNINATAAGADSIPIGNVFTVFNGVTYFAASDGVNGHELWKTDGTAAGTVMVADINTAAGFGSGPYGFTVFNGALYFGADDGVNGRELWKTDGTAAGTVMVANINAGGASSDPFGLTVFSPSDLSGASALYFAAADYAGNGRGRELWKTDGTAAGTVMVANINTAADSNPHGFAALHVGPTVTSPRALFFAADDGVNGRELWKTDGTAAGTVMVANINTATGADSNPVGFTFFNGALYFRADDGVSGLELWKTDGTAAGTVMVANINPGGAGSGPERFTFFNGALYFSALDGVNGTELWKTDGTAAGTVMVRDINPTAGVGSSPFGRRFVNAVVNGVLHFDADDGVNARELWKTDGTAAGTVMMMDICPGACDGIEFF